MDKSNFNDLLERYLTGNVSEKEKEKIEAWLEVMKTENKNDLELSKADEEKLFQKITSANNNIKEIKGFVPAKRTKLWFLQITFSIVVILAITLVWYYNPNTDSKEKRTLADGSIVWLQKGSELTYFEKPDQGIRYAELEGEGLFEIAKDTTRPFIIQCNGTTVKVLGTSFSINSSSKEFTLHVLTGKVFLSTPADSSLIVEHNQKVTIEQSGKILKYSITPSEVTAITSGTQYQMNFNNASLKEVVEKLEQKFDVAITLETSDAHACHITADITDHSLQRSLEVLQDILDITFNIDGKSVTIHGRGCK